MPADQLDHRPCICVGGWSVNPLERRWMRVVGVPVAPAVIGLILGPLAEAQFRRALSISQGDWTVFFTDPLSLALLLIAALALLGPFLWRHLGRHRQICAA